MTKAFLRSFSLAVAGLGACLSGHSDIISAVGSLDDYFVNYNNVYISPSSTVTWNQSNSSFTQVETLSLLNLPNGGLDINLTASQTLGGNSGSQTLFQLTQPINYTFSGSYAANNAPYPNEGADVFGELVKYVPGDYSEDTTIFQLAASNDGEAGGANVPDPFSVSGTLEPGYYQYANQIAVSAYPNASYTPPASQSGTVDLKLTPITTPEPGSFIMSAFLAGLALVALQKKVKGSSQNY